MTKLLASAAITALSIAAMPVLAQSAPPPGVSQGTAPAPMIAPVRPIAPAPVVRENVEVRMMSDRTMTRDDVIRHVREMFQRFDTNHDGYVTKEELEAFHAKFANMGPMIRKRIEDRRMMMGNPAAMFDKMDTNHDGSISRQEFMAAHSQMGENRMVMIENGPGGDHMKMSPEGAEHQKMEFRYLTAAPMRGMEMEMGFGSHLFEMADTNHDGRVSLQEAESLALQHFDRADVNHDGKITPDERQQIHVIMRDHNPG